MNHGTHSGYRDGCRDECCTQAHAEANARYYAEVELPQARARRLMRYRLQGMESRCYDPSARQYHNYGARGITVCDRWRGNLDAFIADVGFPPSPGFSLDRIDNDGPYEPGNVRWATAAQQSANTRPALSDSCRHGHRYTPENLYLTPAGKRSCRTCRREAARRHRAQERAA